MHASVVMPVLQSPRSRRRRQATDRRPRGRQRKLIGGNFSEPGTTSLIGERPLTARARRVDGGYSITGRKMFASMLEAADYVMVMAYPDDATSPSAGMLLLVPPRRARAARERQLGHAGDARDAQRLADPRRLPGAGQRMVFRPTTCGGSATII